MVCQSAGSATRREERAPWVFIWRLARIIGAGLWGGRVARGLDELLEQIVAEHGWQIGLTK